MDITLNQMTRELNFAYSELNEAKEIDLIDSAIHKISSIELRMSHYLKQKKAEESSLYNLNGVRI